MSRNQVLQQYKILERTKPRKTNIQPGSPVTQKRVRTPKVESDESVWFNISV
mgnify:CR=1 FL=1